MEIAVEPSHKAQALDARQADVIREDPAMAVQPEAHADALTPAEPVPVAMLGRASTLELLDPYSSTAGRSPPRGNGCRSGFYIAGYYWDIESGGLALEERGHAGDRQPFVARGLPRDGGLADLLTEARSANPRFAAVVCEDIERSGRDTFNALKLERRTHHGDILLFATDEPIDLDGTDPGHRPAPHEAEHGRILPAAAQAQHVASACARTPSGGTTSAKSWTSTCRTRSRTRPRPKPPRPRRRPCTHPGRGPRPHHRRHLRACARRKTSACPRSTPG